MRKIMLTTLMLCIVAGGVASAAEFFVKHKGDHRRGEVYADAALVYVFRPATMGAAIKTWAFADDDLIGVTRARGYTFTHVVPGTRTVWAKAENTSGLEVELEAGQTYYFKTAVRMGFGKARVKLVQIDESEASKYFDKCSYCEPTEEGRARAEEIAAKRLERAEASAEKRKN